MALNLCQYEGIYSVHVHVVLYTVYKPTHMYMYIQGICIIMYMYVIMCGLPPTVTYDPSLHSWYVKLCGHRSVANDFIHVYTSYWEKLRTSLSVIDYHRILHILYFSLCH